MVRRFPGSAEPNLISMADPEAALLSCANLAPFLETFPCDLCSYLFIMLPKLNSIWQISGCC